jgi:hypothetical protein
MQKINVKDLAGLIHAYQNCVKNHNPGWEIRHKDSIHQMLSTIPGVFQINIPESTSECIVFDVKLHHMNDVGYHVRTVEHKVSITASLFFGLNINVEGDEDVKDAMTESFNELFELRF